MNKLKLEFISSKEVNNEELYLYLNKEGADVLMRAIEHAKNDGHDHLSTPDWAGNELSITEGSKNTFHKITITYVGD